MRATGLQNQGGEPRLKYSSLPHVHSVIIVAFLPTFSVLPIKSSPLLMRIVSLCIVSWLKTSPIKCFSVRLGEKSGVHLRPRADSFIVMTAPQSSAFLYGHAAKRNKKINCPMFYSSVMLTFFYHRQPSLNQVSFSSADTAVLRNATKRLTAQSRNATMQSSFPIMGGFILFQLPLAVESPAKCNKIGSIS